MEKHYVYNAMNKFSKKNQTKVFKIKVWKTNYADSRFSQFIRERDGRCMRCRRTDKPLDCSHYWKRGDSATRFDPLNCIALCRDCHTIWERRKNYEYREYMLKTLGEEAYTALEIRARTFQNRREAVMVCMKLLA